MMRCSGSGVSSGGIRVIGSRAAGTGIRWSCGMFGLLTELYAAHWDLRSMIGYKRIVR